MSGAVAGAAVGVRYIHNSEALAFLSGLLVGVLLMLCFGMLVDWSLKRRKHRRSG